MLNITVWVSIINDLIEKIERTKPKGKTRLVAIDGRGGSGKSTLVKQILKNSLGYKILEVDWFPCLPKEYPFHALGTQTRVSMERLKKEALIPLRDGKAATFKQHYWWKQDKRPPNNLNIEPGGTVIVDGCYSLHQDIRDFMDFSIWVACDPEEGVKRAVARDGEDVRMVWEQVYFKNEQAYVLSHRPDLYADITVCCDDNGTFEVIK